MKKLIVLALAALCASCGSSSSPSAPSSGGTTAGTTWTLSGTVTSLSTGAGITGATLTINDGPNTGRTTTSLAGGSYSLSGLTTSGFSMVVSAPGYANTARGITLTSNLSQTFNLGPLGLFSASGVGATVLDVPDYVMQLRVTGTLNVSSANFAMWFGPHNIACGVVINGGCHLLVNELIGPSFGRPTYSGTVSTGAGGTNAVDTLSVVNSTGVAWTVTEVASR